MAGVYELLLEKSKYWKNMDRSDEEHRKKAEDYYKKELMPVITEHFIQENKIEDECEALVLTLGMSYEPLVLSILAFMPKKVLILYTDKSYRLLDDVIGFTGLKASQYSTSKVDEKNPLQLYKEIKDAYEKWGRPENVYVDFTGGTKPMAAGCAMAGSAIGAKLVYIGSEYLDDLKKSDPGSEKLCYIDDPYVVFGDIEKDKAISLFNSMDYILAYKIFEELDRKVPGTKEYNALKFISKAYNAWESLDIRGAAVFLNKCLEIIETEGKLSTHFVLYKHKKNLTEQRNVLKILEKIHHANDSKEEKTIVFSNVGYLLANLYQNAIRREKQEKFEMAALLLYRVLEIIEQKRLWNYGIDTSDAEYTGLRYDEDLLLKKINDVIKKTRDLNKFSHLEKKIGLLNGYILLAALEDDIFTVGKFCNAVDISSSLKKLRSNVEARNKSIFAHGYEFIDKKKYYNFKQIVDEYIERFCLVEGIDKENLFQIFEFIKLQ